ncbi:uncharacterized protein LOC121880103 [Homarus americanus]|uniref:uncharacterized protein LOC121880103 n=1 Tax=Homarus americanus TaxID=6706 RepID=UPI001C494F23|nr:uncharacterized protein LOC121880103 [Homarus americanus]
MAASSSSVGRMITSKLDDLLTQLGTGKWNVLFFIVIGYWNMHLAPHTLGISFLAPMMDYSCVPPDHAFTITSITYDADGTNHTTIDNCHYYINITEGGGGFTKKPCDKWAYDNHTFVSTLTSEFNLVCSSEYLRPIYSSLYMFGTLVGAPMNGILSDRYGRKTMLSIGLFAYFSIATASTWIPVFSGILVVRFILGLFHPVVLQSGYILVMEVTEPRYRSVVGILISLPWAIGTVAWGAIAYFLRDWKWLQLAVTLPVFLLLPLLWFIDESPRWLIVNGHIDRAHKVLKKAARWNHSSLPPAEELTILMRAIQKESATAKDAAREEHGELTCKQRVCNSIRRLFILFRTPKLLLITVMLCFNFFSVGSIYYGMSLNAVNYSADPHVYMMLGGVVEIPAYTVTAPIIARFGRKWPNIVFYLICGSVIMALAFIPSNIMWLVMTLAMIGKMCISAVYQILYLYSMELFPTEVRLQGLGISTIASRIGTIVSPFVTDYLGPLYSWVPSLVFGVVALLSGVSMLPLKETLGTKIPDTITDLENPGHQLILSANSPHSPQCQCQLSTLTPVPTLHTHPSANSPNSPQCQLSKLTPVPGVPVPTKLTPVPTLHTHPSANSPNSPQCQLSTLTPSASANSPHSPQCQLSKLTPVPTLHTHPQCQLSIRVVKSSCFFYSLYSLWCCGSFRMVSSTSTFDDLLTELGTGKWNYIYFYAASLWFCIIPPQALSGTFLAPAIGYSCRPPSHYINATLSTDSCSYLVNTTATSWEAVKERLQKEEEEEEWVPCTMWDFDTLVFSSTLTSEFGLVCERQHLRAFYQSIFMIGNFISPILGGYLADRFGRKIVSGSLLLVLTTVGIAICCLNNFAAILACRFILGCVNLSTFYVLAMEVCETKHRSIVGIMSALPWAFGTMGWGGAGYLIRDWRWLQLAITLPSILLYPALWFMDESPRWLIVRGQHNRAMKVLEKAARWNKATLPPRDQLLAMMKEIQQSADYGEGLRHSHHHLGVEEEGGEVGKKEGQKGREVTKRRCGRHLLPRLCSNRPIRVIVIIMCVDFLVASMVFYGLSLNGASLSADPFLYLVLTGLMEVPAYTLTVPIIARFGRRIPTALGYFVSAISILTLAFIPLEISWLVMTLAMLSKMCITAAYQTLYVYVTELLPTEVRIQGSGAVKVSARIGSTVSPFITDYLSSVVAWGPALVFGGASMVAGLVTLTVSETLGTPLPDTLADLLPKPQKTSARESDLEGDTKEMVSLMT